MKANDIIRTAIETADMIVRTYLDDLTDDEMMHRPDPKCNHINWQSGHLILSDNEMLNSCRPDMLPALPQGFAERYAKEKASLDDRSDFHSKAELFELAKVQRTELLRQLFDLTPQDLEIPAPESIASYAPNLGAALSMIAIHWTMHSGQWAVIRRQLGRDVVI